ncbi:MAG: hypothetical protein WC742_01865 [Gallionellaceae bacterium]
MNKIFFAVIVSWLGIISGCANNPPVSSDSVATKATTLDEAEKAQSELSSAVTK